MTIGLVLATIGLVLATIGLVLATIGLVLATIGLVLATIRAGGIVTNPDVIAGVEFWEMKDWGMGGGI